jgi:hypothetical protein
MNHAIEANKEQTSAIVITTEDSVPKLSAAAAAAT